MTKASKPTELSKINDPNFVLELAVGPPHADLVPQDPNSGFSFGRQYLDKNYRFLFKKAHLSATDFRIFDTESGELVLCSHHLGKNPYGSLDPLGVTQDVTAPFGEWESICEGTGYRGMPSFKVRPKFLSKHGKQFIQDLETDETYFNVAKQSRIKTKSLRHNLVVCKGDTEEVIYTVLVDLSGRTMQIVNEKEERVANIEKSVKTLIMNASFGVGSELMIDIAPGVDWTAILAIVIGIMQVGKNIIKDAFSNFVVNPLQGLAVDKVEDTVEGGEDESGGAGEEDGEEEEQGGDAGEEEQEQEEDEGDEGDEGEEGGGIGGAIAEIFGAIFSG